MNQFIGSLSAKMVDFESFTQNLFISLGTMECVKKSRYRDEAMTQ